MAGIDYDIAQQTWRGGNRWPVRAIANNSPTKVELHHTVIRSSVEPVDQARAIYDMHVHDKGWSDIFYAVGVHPSSGEIIDLRGLTKLSQSDLSGWGTVTLLGDMRYDPLSDAAIDSLLEIIRCVGDPIRGHGDRAATACPGDHVRDFIDAYNRGDYDDWDGDDPVAYYEARQVHSTTESGGNTPSYVTDGVTKRKINAEERDWLRLAGFIPPNQNQKLGRELFDSIPTVS